MNTSQREIANEVRERGDDYFLALKESPPNHHDEVEGVFEAIRDQSATGK
jgi:hypothetical protein